MIFSLVLNNRQERRPLKNLATRMVRGNNTYDNSAVHDYECPDPAGGVYSAPQTPVVERGLAESYEL